MLPTTMRGTIKVTDRTRAVERGEGSQLLTVQDNCSTISNSNSNCNSRQLLPKVKNQSWQHTHTSIHRLGPKEPPPPQRARFDSACCHSHTPRHTPAHSPRFLPFFGPSRAQSLPLHRWLNLEPSNRPKIQSGAKHRAIRTCSPPSSLESAQISKISSRVKQ